MKIKFVLGKVSLLSLAISMSGTAFAQTAPQASDERGSASVDEIIVTANKREQSLNRVGLTIQAATGDELVQRGVTSVADLAKLVPGFTATQSLYSTPVYTLRGIGLYDATFGAAPSVSVYTDQIPRNVPVMSDALDLDIEHFGFEQGYDMHGHWSPAAKTTDLPRFFLKSSAKSLPARRRPDR